MSKRDWKPIKGYTDITFEFFEGDRDVVKLLFRDAAGFHDLGTQLLFNAGAHRL